MPTIFQLSIKLMFYVETIVFENCRFRESRPQKTSMMGMEDKSHQWWRLKRQVINGEDYKKLLGEVIGSNESLFINTSLHHVIRVGTCKHPHILYCPRSAALVDQQVTTMFTIISIPKLYHIHRVTLLRLHLLHFSLNLHLLPISISFRKSLLF